jgi:hypothetical protein
MNGDTDCGEGLFAGPNTSCPFAVNVREQYWAATDQQRVDPGGGVVIDVCSPVTEQTYTMNCVRTGDTITCRGGNNAVALQEAGQFSVAAHWSVFSCRRQMGSTYAIQALNKGRTKRRLASVCWADRISRSRAQPWRSPPGRGSAVLRTMAPPILKDHMSCRPRVPIGTNASRFRGNVATKSARDRTWTLQPLTRI